MRPISGAQELGQSLVTAELDLLTAYPLLTGRNTEMGDEDVAHIPFSPGTLRAVETNHQPVCFANKQGVAKALQHHRSNPTQPLADDR